MALTVPADRVSVLLEFLLQAAADPSHWPRFIEALNAMLGAEKGSLVRHRLSMDTAMYSTESAQLFHAGYDPEGVALYNQHYGKDDPYARGFRVRRIQSSAGLCFDLVDHATMRRSGFYNDFARRFDVCYLCWIAITDPNEHTALSLVRSEKREPFGDAELEILSLFVPHLKQAVSLNRTLQLLRMQSAIGQRTAEAFDVAVVSVDGSGRVITMSAAAEKLLSKLDGIRLQNRKLSLDCPAEHTRFETVLQGAVRTGKGEDLTRPLPSAPASQLGKRALRVPKIPCGGGMLVTRRKHNSSLQLTVFPFHSDAVLQDDRPCALIFLHDPDQRVGDRRGLLTAMYGLTVAESHLAELVAAGVELQAAATQLQITKETARDRLKQVFRKTGVSRQPELVHLLTRLPEA